MVTSEFRHVLSRTLTNNGQDDHHHVKDIPAVGEVIVAKSKELQQEFHGEDHNKDEVDPVEDHLRFIRLIVCFYHHGDHVEADKDHDGDVKDLLSDEVKHHSLDLVLQRNKERFQLRALVKTIEQTERERQHT